MTARRARVGDIAPWRTDALLRRRAIRAGAVAVTALVAGVSLLALAGWFIASSAVAGLAVASTFSFLYPSAGVQSFAVARTLSRYGERISAHGVTLDVVGRLRVILFERALRLPRGRAERLRSSELLGRITADTDAVDNVLLRSALPGLVAVAAVLGAAALFALLSIRLMELVVAGMCLTAAFLLAVARHQATRLAHPFVAARAGARLALIEAADGLPELRSFGAEQVAAAEVARQLEAFAAARRRLADVDGRGRAIGVLLADLTLVGVVAGGAGLLFGSSLSAPAFVMAALVAVAVFEPIAALSAAVASLVRGRAAADRLLELFVDSPGLAVNRSARLEPDGPWSVTISFDDSSIAVQDGEMVIVSGVSGAGKSTLLRAIAGDQVEGIEILIGEVPTSAVADIDIPRHVTLVSQDAHLFDGTIRENLLLAGQDARDDELWSALAAAALQGVVAELPLGLDTPIGPGGRALSGGQRRRLSVAQGVLRRPNILLLDEPTEGLETELAERVLIGVRAYLPRATLFVALHDRQVLSTRCQPVRRIELGRSRAIRAS